MNTLKTLKNLISKLSHEEVKTLLVYLRAFRQEAKGKNLKGFQLVNLVLKNNEITYDVACKKLYGDCKRETFNKLIIRIKGKIHEILLLDSNLSKPIYSDRNKIIFELRKRLIQIQILHLRGMNDEIESMFNKIILKAKKHEVYDVVVEALETKQRFRGFRYGKVEFDHLEREIQHFEKCRKYLKITRKFYSELGAKAGVVAHRRVQNYLRIAMNKIKVYYRRTYSAEISYYYYVFKMAIYNYREDYKMSIVVLKKLVYILENNSIIFTKIRFREALLNLSNNYLAIKNTKQAINYIQLGKKYFDNFANSLVLFESEFLARFYQGDYRNSQILVDEVSLNSGEFKSPFHVHKFDYYSACLRTVMGFFEQSNNLLKGLNWIARDKEGWNIGQRILIIINRIEAENFDSADLKVMSLEKFIKRIAKSRHVRKRDTTILRILRSLINEGYNFNKVYKMKRKYFDLLKKEHGEYSWKHLSPELIVFHKWFEAKMEGKPYRFSLG